MEGQGRLLGDVLLHQWGWPVQPSLRAALDYHQRQHPFLPWSWRVFQVLLAPGEVEGWVSHFHEPTPSTPPIPQALRWLSRPEGTIWIEIDLNPDGERRVWWEDHEASTIGCLAYSWVGLSSLVSRGPQGLLHECLQGWEKPSELRLDQMPLDPVTRSWLLSIPETNHFQVAYLKQALPYTDKALHPSRPIWAPLSIQSEP